MPNEGDRETQPSSQALNVDLLSVGFSLPNINQQSATTINDEMSRDDTLPLLRNSSYGEKQDDLRQQFGEILRTLKPMPLMIVDSANSKFTLKTDNLVRIIADFIRIYNRELAEFKRELSDVSGKVKKATRVKSKIARAASVLAVPSDRPDSVMNASISAQEVSLDDRSR